MDPTCTGTGTKRQRRISDSSGCIIQSLHNVQKVEVLPYHTLGAYKWKELGYEYPLEGIDPPTQERIKMQISCCIQERGFKVFTGHIIIEMS